MNTGPRLGTLLLLGTTALSGFAAWGGQKFLVERHQPLTPDRSAAQLWTTYRWAIDPQQRREAALLMAAQTGSYDVLQSQAWGTSPLGAVALELEAETATRRGDQSHARKLWYDLLKRFPHSAASASARRVLGDQNPALHQDLLKKQPSHPAALSVAESMVPNSTIGYQGAIHLARWGARWPGAFKRISQACNDHSSIAPTTKDRQWLARGLASLGDGPGALQCLQRQQPGSTSQPSSEPSTQLAIGQALLRGGHTEEGTELLLNLTRNLPEASASVEAARLLSEPVRPSPEVLDAIPVSVQNRSGALAAARVRLANGEGGEDVLQRWPDDPDVWQLQWDLAREALLSANWDRAKTILTREPSAQALPDPLETRRLYWLGWSEAQLGDPKRARTIWQLLISQFPPGYYHWLASEALGDATPLNLTGAPTPTQSQLMSWAPLNSAQSFVNTLWRLGLKRQAWETWRSGIDPNTPQPKPEQLVEGRLRLAVGDSWMALDQLRWLSLRWRSASCRERIDLHHSQHPKIFKEVLHPAASAQQLPLELLLAVSKQESRFASGVTSTAGAIGLMQLMPATARDVAEAPLTEDEIREPKQNAALGAAYLRQLLSHWRGDPFRSIASYNAGPGAVGSWSTQGLNDAPALWVERIPYPETRYYTKKVLDNFFGYLGRDKRFCEPTLNGIGQDMP
ncbi:MAG: transglycosylase SLT domain-containing protein [Parasynechococcus sp.]